MNRILKLSGLLLMAPLLLLTYSCETDDAEASVGALVGTWELSALTGTYIRDIAQPEGNTTTSYSVTASWNYASTVLGADSANADQVLASYSVGDTLLNTTSSLPNSQYLEIAEVAMTGVFKKDNVYTLAGTYPTIRLNENPENTEQKLCESYQTTAQISDQGFYGVVYNSDNTGGTLTITHDASLGDQVLPPFPDGTVTFTNDGNSLKIEFTDRDSHDSKYAEVQSTWDEEGKRVTTGVATAPVNSSGAFDPTSDSTSYSGYLMDSALAAWGGYATFYYLIIAGEAKYLANAGLITDDGDGSLIPETIYYMTVNNATGSTYGTNPFPYSGLVSSAGVPTDDSAHDFDPTNLPAGGKLTYVINPICIPVNEIIIFDADFEKQAD